MRKGLLGGVAGIVITVPLLTWVIDKIGDRIDHVEEHTAAEIKAVERRLRAAIEAEGDNLRARLNAYVEAGILRNPHDADTEDC